MKTTRPIAALFVIAALYDAVLGAVFLLAPAQVFRTTDVTPPNHWAYVQFPAALLLIFGWMFFAIARKPVENKGLIVYGILLKVAYCSITFWYWSADGIPGMWKPFAAIDLVMAVLFVWSYRELSIKSLKTCNLVDDHSPPLLTPAPSRCGGEREPWCSRPQPGWPRAQRRQFDYAQAQYMGILPQEFHGLFGRRAVEVDNADRLAPLILTANVHLGDVDPFVAQSPAEKPDQTGPVHVGKDQKCSVDVSV